MSLAGSARGESSLWRASVVHEAYPELKTDTTADLVIVGGGYSGCSAALHAARSGASVVLLEANEIGSGGSGRNVGLVNAGLWLSPNEVTKTLGEVEGERLNRSLMSAPEMVFSLIEEHRIECDARRRGTLQCAHSKRAFKALHKRADQVNARGGTVQVLTDIDASKRIGTEAIKGALFDPRAGTIHPLKYCLGLARTARAAGARIFQKSPATRIDRYNGDWIVSTGVATVRSKCLLIAANAYLTDDLTKDTPSRFTPVGYFQLATEPLTDNVRGDILRGEEGCWDTAQVMSSYRVDAEGRLIIGSVGALGRSRIRSAWAQRKVANLFPRLRSVRFDYAWHGTIAMTSDHLPKVLHLGPNAYSIFGYSGRGIGPGTVFGKAAADALLADDPAFFPITPIRIYQEQMTHLKSFVYQWGSSFVLGTSVRL